MFVNNCIVLADFYKADCSRVVFGGFRCDQCFYIFHLFAKETRSCCHLMYRVDSVKSSGAFNSGRDAHRSLNELLIYSSTICMQLYKKNNMYISIKPIAMNY